MRAEGVLRDRSRPRTWPRKQTLSGCKMKGKLDNFVLIDVDSDSLNNVVIIDVPESLQQKLRGSSVLRKGKKIQFGGIINIDDDESNNMEYPEVGVEAGADLDSDTSSSKSFPASDYVHKSVNLGDDECRVVRENNSAFRLSKCKRPYPVKNACRNRYGLNPESESSSSDSDCSDCELMEGSFGKLHKEWEKASLKRKSNICKGKSGLGDRGSPSCLNNDIRPNIDVGVEERTEQHSETAFCCNSSSANHKKQSVEDGDLGTASLSPGIKNTFVESDQKVDKESFPWFKPGLVEKVHSSRKKADFLFRGETFTEELSSSTSQWQNYKHVNGCGCNFCDKEQDSHGPSFRCNQEQNDKQHHNRTSFMNKPKNFMGEQFNPKGIPRFFHHTKAALDDEESSLWKSQQWGETHANCETAVPSDKYEEFSQTTSSRSGSLENSNHTRTGFMEKGKPNSQEPSVSNYQPSPETGVECGVAPSEQLDVFDESFLCKTSSTGLPDVCNEKAVQLDTEKLDSKGVFTCNSERTKTQSKQGNSCSEKVKGQVIDSTADGQLCNGRDPFIAQSFSVTAAVPNDIINEREKLKETDEYKQAMEEEWASRQRQLQIQAEEAQRLRKKKRAESMRLLDMERRQKQRLEEIRETQKKDEENMNLREQIRVEVRKELHKLETICTDMASLLRALGIHVGGSFHPLSHDVHAAYKRALLRFHPDRASKTDIRQQVEAEEKFKLISRMKEKFLLTSCH